MLKTMAETPGKINMRCEGPFTVTEKKRNVSYKIVSNDSRKGVVVHAYTMKKFQGHASLEAITLTARQTTRKRARFLETNNKTTEPSRYNW
jgi:hypothetical protein